MPNFPPNSVKMKLVEHLQIRPNAHKRVIDPNTGYQYEVLYKDVQLACPICQYMQPAPPCAGVDYQCPKCKWNYKIYEEMLVVWNPATLGVSTEALAPGTNPYERAVDDSGGQDPERADAIYEESRQDWLKTEANREKWAKRIQSLGGFNGTQGDDLPDVHILPQKRKGNSVGGGVPEEPPAGTGNTEAESDSGSDDA